MERARIIIIKQGQLLTIRRTRAEGVYWVLPGGALEANESVEDALIREGKEELGIEIVAIKKLISLANAKKGLQGQMEHFYMCDIKSGVLGTGDGPEYQVGGGYHGTYDISWIPLENLAEYDLRPNKVRDLLLSQT